MLCLVFENPISQTEIDNDSITHYSLFLQLVDTQKKMRGIKPPSTKNYESIIYEEQGATNFDDHFLSGNVFDEGTE